MTPHRPLAGECRGIQLRTPKEQHLSVNLSGPRTVSGSDALESGGLRATRPWGKARAATRTLNLSGTQRQRERTSNRLRPPSVRSAPVHDPTSFAARHIGPDSDDLSAMLGVIGVESLGRVGVKALPADIPTSSATRRRARAAIAARTRR